MIKLNMKKFICRLVCCSMLILGSVATAFAATSGTLTGSLSNSWGTAKLKNTSGSSRYCNVYIKQYDYASSITIAATNTGVISSGNTISASGTISKLHAKGVGNIYISNSYQSGIGKTLTTDIK